MSPLAFGSGRDFARVNGVVTDGLILSLNAMSASSYLGTGTTWTDLSSNGNNSTLINSPSYGDGGLIFDGVNDYATIPAFTYTPYCLDFWVYNNTQINNNDAGVGGPSYYQTLFRNLTDLQLSLGGWTSAMSNETLHILSGSKYTYINETIPSGYHNWVYNWNGSNYDIWVDGVKKTAIASTSGHAALTQQTSTSYIAYNAGSYYFYGNIYSIKIYGSQVTDKEIQQNFNALRGKFGI